VPSQRFEGLAAAEAVVKSDRSCWESRESRDFSWFLLGQPAEIGGQLAKNLVAVEKGTKAVILLNLSIFGERTFNNLQTKISGESASKRVFQHPRDLSSTNGIVSANYRQFGSYLVLPQPRIPR
jgi:hypothetical protein